MGFDASHIAARLGRRRIFTPVTHHHNFRGADSDLISTVTDLWTGGLSLYLGRGANMYNTKS